MKGRVAMQDVYGWVSNIQRFCVHDGDGIRTTVFLQGCALRCLWCCNPENMSAGPRLKYNEALCTACGRCAAVCPNGAPAVRNGRLAVDRARCGGCGACVPACPNQARSICGVRMNAAEVLRQVERDAAFYRKSGGGLTLSGGECLLQPDFTKALLCGAKERFIHTAIETCGYAEWQAFERILPYTDLFLFDIKHPNAQAHRRLTGRGSGPILRNLSRLAAHGARIILRVPVVAGCNDAAGTLLKTAQLAKRNRVERVELLPYHKLGIRKYEMLGLQYGGAALCTPEPEELSQKAALMRQIFPNTVIKKM